MCDICTKADAELTQFVEELENRYPGTEIDGVEVERNHHVVVALAVALERQALKGFLRTAGEMDLASMKAVSEGN
jgi:hypothetical protein